jgi:predicted phosphohydrolase
MPEAVAELAPDVFVVAGDVSAELSDVEDFLSRFDAARCHKLFVPGNHDIWVLPWPGQSSRTKYERDLPEVCRRTGFHFLPGRPMVIRGVGFAGSIGWYDYSLRDLSLDRQISMDDYRRKRFRGRMWSDARYARWGATDEQVTEEMASELGRDLDELEAAGAPVVAVVHHLPFEELVVRRGEVGFDFFSAFMGSSALGRVIRARPMVKVLIFGHTHFEQDVVVDGIRALAAPLGYEHERPEGAEEALRKSVRTVEVGP